MTLHDPVLSLHPPLLTPTTSFPALLHEPERHTLPDGELLVFRFTNGYGAAVTCPATPEARLDFCVLDCTVPVPQPCFDTPVSGQFLSGLTHAGTQGLLMLTERLPVHPRRAAANAALLHEEF
ncbi:hypothetical protein [Deinococcus sp. 12RED42]|uniref:hypothetical protein n=1 Tax=Deinococcus sp. 12RED42 TaxID=2745872 RepID=UPI001E572707|nr:hypothetical protein [Deinococcus sp. 12RED42]MCD0167909.1 hypothetical protein [Deinococcus sp. 12RED42]